MENTHQTLRVQAQHPGASQCPSPRSEIGFAPSRVVTCAYSADLVAPVTLAVFAAHVHEHPLVTWLPRDRRRRPGKDQRLPQPGALPPPGPVCRILPAPARRAPAGGQPAQPGYLSCQHCPQPQQRRFHRGRPRHCRCPARAATTALARTEGRHRARRALTVSAGSQRADLTGRRSSIVGCGWVADI